MNLDDAIFGFPEEILDEGSTFYRQQCQCAATAASSIRKMDADYTEEGRTYWFAVYTRLTRIMNSGY